MKKFLIGLLLLSLALVFVPIGDITAQDDIPSASIIATADGLTVPENLSSGLVTMTFENQGEGPFIALVVRLNDGVTMDDFLAAIAEDPLGMLPLVHLKGGPAVMPGQSTDMTLMLESGDYVVLNLGAEIPQMASLSVTDGEGMAYEEPVADVDVLMVDFGYGVPLTIPDGEHVWRIQNVGDQWHEMAIAPIDADTTIDDVRGLLAEGEESTLEQLPILMPIDSGEVTWLTVDLEPGHYALICNLPDIMASEEHTHHELGMLTLITVTDTTEYEDEAGLFSLDYPAELDAYPNLFAEVDESMIFPHVAFSSSPEVNELSMASELVPSDGWGFAVIFMPKAIFSDMGIAEDASIAEFAEIYVMGQIAEFIEDEAEMEAMLDMLSVESITLADGSEAAQVDLPDETEDNLIMFFEPAEGVIGLVSLLTAPGERTDEQIDHLMVLVNSIQFNATADDLMMDMGGE